MSKPIPIQDSPCENQNSFNSAYNTALQKSENLCANQPQFNKALSTAVDNLPPELTLHSNVCKDQDTFNHSYAKAVDKYNEIEYNKLTNNQKIVFSILIVLQFIFIIWGIILAIRFIPEAQRPLHIVFAITTGPIYVLAFYLSLIGGKLKYKK